MAIYTGTLNNDTLIGSDEADTLIPYGVQYLDPPDYMSGGNGGDTYDLGPTAAPVTFRDYVIDDQGSDGAIDTITGPGALYQSGSLGYSAHVSAVRIGDDLEITTPSKPAAFHVQPVPSYHITVIDQYAGAPVEVLVAGGTSYNLPTGIHGTNQADLMAGTNFDDTLKAGGGDDFILGNDGNDELFGGSGVDQIYGDTGNDQIHGQAGNDWLYGGAGLDTVLGGADSDFIYLEEGDDKAAGQSGSDFIFGQDGNDLILGGAGLDMLSGGRGDDTLKGGADGDIYRFGYDVDNFGSMDDPGHDVIRDKGEAPTFLNEDRIDLFGYYGPSDGLPDEAYARVSFARVGNDMVITSDGGQDSLTVKGQFKAADVTQIESLNFYGAYWDPLAFEILDAAKTDVTNDRNYGGGETGERNEIIFGTDGADEVFGNSGTNFIWLGGGADTLIYKQADPQPATSAGGGAAHDIVEDFDITADVMDFTEIAGLALSDLVISQDGNGDATIYWDSGTFEVSDIFIELRGVAQAEVAADLFLFA